MKKTQNNNNRIEEQLSDFTDNILDEKTAEVDENPFASDPKLRALEQTALRLKNAFREDGPSEEVIRRMRKNIRVQWQQQEAKKSEPFWKKWIPARQQWQSQRSRQRVSMAVSLAILVVLMVLTIPLLNGTNLEQPAASGQNLSTGILAALAGFILLAVWLYRNKR